MSMQGNPFFQQGVRTYFAHAGILRTYLFLPAGLAVVLVVVWPRAGLETILRNGPFVDTFSAVAIAFLALLLYLGARYGSEDFSPEPMVQLREYVTMTPVSLVSVVLGKAGFSLLHTLFLLLLGAPLLLASMAVSGLTLADACAAFVILGTASLAARMFGLLVLTLVGTRAFVRDAILLPVILAVVVVVLLSAPPISPVHALIGLSSTSSHAPGSLSMFSPAAASSLASCGAACLGATGVFFALRIHRRRAGRRARE
jgi:hypothetical protein